jgi:diamine N-acetyltransferase
VASSSNAWVFRVPEPQEAAALAALGRATFVSTFGHLYSAENLARFFTEAYVVESIAAELVDLSLRWLVVEDSLAPGILIGFCKLSIGTSLPVGFAGRSVMECKQLYLLDAYHGRGIADDLMRWAFAQAALVGAQDMVLCVYSDNVRAQRFYQRHGFAKYMDYHFMVGDHRDEEYILHCQLSP